MPETGSVGAISLDLTIQDKLTEQIDRAISAARSHAANISRELEKAMTEPLKQAAAKTKSITIPVEVKTGNVAEEIHDIADKAETAINIPVDIEPESAFRAVEEKMSSIAESIREKLGAVDFPTEKAERFTAQIDVLAEKLSLMQKTWQELSAADPFSTASERAGKLETKIADLESRLAKLSKGSKVTVPETKKVRTPAVTVPQTSSDKSSTSAVDVSSAMSGGIGGIAGMIGTAISGNPAVGSAVSSVANTITGTLGGAFKSLNSLINKVTGNASVKLKKLIGNIVDITKPVRKLGETLKRAFKAVFLAAGAYAAFRALKDELLEAANADERFAKSLNEVKANLSIAFTPIIQHIMPMLDIFMEKLAVVSKQIAGFTAGLFGMTYKQAADATKKIKDITAAAKKAKLTVAGIDELNILSDNSEDERGIDYSKLDMSEPELPDWAERLKASIRNGDWTGAGRALADKVNEVLGSVNWNKAEQKVKEKVKHLADLINGFTDELDPRGIGDSIAGTLNTVTGAITTFADDIDWGRIGRKLAQGLNRAIHKIKWRQLGKALTSGIRILTDVLYDFSEEFDFQKLGEGLSKALNGAVDNIDTAKIGKTLSNIIKGAITTATSFLEGTDFNKIGEKIGDFLENIDSEGILRGGAALVRKIFDSMLSVAEGLLDKTDWASIGLSIGRGLGGGEKEGIKEGMSGESGIFDGSLARLVKVFVKLKFTFIELAAAIGVGIVWGIFDGITGELESVGKWIDDNITTPIIDGIKEKFGIRNGSSTKTKNIGSSLMTGLKNGASDKLESAKKVFTGLREDIENTFSDIGDWFKDRFEEASKGAKDAFSSIGVWFAEKYGDIKAPFLKVGSWFGERFKAARDNIERAFTDIGSYFGKRWNDIKEHYSSVGSWFRDRFEAAYDNIDEVWSGLPDIFKDVWADIKESTIESLNDILDGLNEFTGRFADVFDALSGAGIGAKVLIPKISKIPHLATGALAKAPTLAMVGDNRNASVDPEVISPLSKLQGMLELGSSNTEIVELLRLIVELLRNGISAELIGSMFGSDFKRTVLKIVAEDSARRG
ncbi:MAG: hypothetical protein IKP25_05205 [Ruminococcus sp.]|nr:hypothetical protein [Ruminococcus sp.]